MWTCWTSDNGGVIIRALYNESSALFNQAAGPEFSVEMCIDLIEPGKYVLYLILSQKNSLPWIRTFDRDSMRWLFRPSVVQ